MSCENSTVFVKFHFEEYSQLKSFITLAPKMVDERLARESNVNMLRCHNAGWAGGVNLSEVQFLYRVESS
jgi:hypothetical protein